MLPSLLLIAACAALTKGAVTVVEQGDKKDFFLEGDKIVLECKSTESGATVEWLKYDPTDSKNKSVEARYVVVPASTTGQANFAVSSLAVADNGQYYCVDKKGGEYGRAINVIPNDKKKILVGTDLVTYGTKQKVELKCEQPFVKKLPLIWTFVDSSKKPHVFTVSGAHNNTNFTVNGEKDGYSLTIKNAGEGVRHPTNFGTYHCAFDLTNVTDGSLKQQLQNVQSSLNYQAVPDIVFEGAAKSKSATKDETFSMTCIVSGADDKKGIQWSRGENETGAFDLIGSEDTYDVRNPTELPAHCARESKDGRDLLSCKVGNDDKFTIVRDLTAENQSCSVLGGPCIRKSTLQFSNVVEDDRAYYRCLATNDFGDNNATIPVKVKDKLAALWPFLGIVAEVVILCAIIFIYERRRSKSIEEEEEQEPMKTDARDGNDGVRNRKS